MRTRFITTIIGLFLLPAGLGVIIYYNQGMSSFDTFISMLSNLMNVSYSVALLIFQFSILAILLLLKRKLCLTWPDIITPFFAVLFISKIINLSVEFSSVHLSHKPMSSIFISFIIFAYGLTMLVRGNMVVAPNDKALIVMSKYLTHTYAFYKFIFDVLLLVIAAAVIYVNGYDIKLNWLTFLLTFGTAPVVGMFTKLNSILFRL